MEINTSESARTGGTVSSHENNSLSMKIRMLAQTLADVLRQSLGGATNSGFT